MDTIRPLSPRQARILALRETGLSNKQVAAELGLSLHTVKGHIGMALRLLSAGSTMEALAKLRKAAQTPARRGGLGSGSSPGAAGNR